MTDPNIAAMMWINVIVQDGPEVCQIVSMELISRQPRQIRTQMLMQLARALREEERIMRSNKL